ncbi:ParA family protein (plasmid) [Borrelia miyamotoi]|uniref:ParA family protein n=1 Tax=Borrelia miyamotoi TaxID=47466 RepID=A0A481YGQ5_9SPIR|nr:ParA family protein [Borrelia miyamotoi]ATQ19061.1 ParA family protein [Borrelia miyamotoi]ATQ20244.1 ParA family protein [Borrelia miyamotoi]QBK63912.1 ParA family protein [Borrelia miyamotoi]QBL99349.1 ParA family protein [Borrelia miyamotoi]WAZ72702.1 ParA family protein [Borrelia miyamotoi]
MDTEKPKVITIASIKGGVGKSTSAIIFATLLSKKYKVLLIDMDTQASITSYFYGKIKEKGFDLFGKNIYEVLKGNLLINNGIINVENNLDLLPSYLSLHTFSEESLPYKEHRLKNSFKYLKFKYNFIILDTNPHLDSTLSNALVISNYVIVPMTAEKWSIESLQLLEFFIHKLDLKPQMFLFVTKFKKNNTHRDLLEMLRKKEGFLGTISEREDLNRRIAQNDVFDLNKDYIKEYMKTFSYFDL